jgi:hypothetical protein
MQQIKGKDMTYQEFDMAMEKLLTPEPDPPLSEPTPFVHPEHKEDPKQYTPEEIEAKRQPPVFHAPSHEVSEVHHAETPRPHYPSPPKARGRPPKAR